MMRAEVLVFPRAAPGRHVTSPLYTYTVPSALVASIAPGQLVAVPFGERVVAGIVWALDASDDLPDALPNTSDELPDQAASPGGAHPSHNPLHLKPLAGILLPQPVLLPAQQALAEQIAAYYAAPLASAVR